MTYAEFRQWAWDTHRHRLHIDGDSEGLRAAWLNGSMKDSRAGTGSGNHARYGPLQQRRFAIWFRTRGIVDKMHVTEWIRAGEDKTTGWLVNDGTGVRWVANPEDEWKDLLTRGFVAIRCGAETKETP